MRDRSLALVVRNQKILMIQEHRFNRLFWGLPGGGVEAGETPAEAAVRELKEETGLDGTVVRPLNTIHTRRGNNEYIFLIEVSDDREPIVGTDPEVGPGGEQAIKDVAWREFDKMSEKDRAFLCSYGILEVEGFFEIALTWGDEVSYPSVQES